MTFAAGFPAWTGRDGRPRSYRHFVYGMAHLHRAHLRRALELAEAHRIGNATQPDFDRFSRDVTLMTEVPRNG